MSKNKRTPGCADIENVLEHINKEKERKEEEDPRFNENTNTNEEKQGE